MLDFYRTPTRRNAAQQKMTSDDQSTPTLLIFLNVFITLCFLGLATLANRFLLLRDDKSRKAALNRKIESRSFNSGTGRPHNNLPLGGIFKAVKKPSTQSMNRFLEQSNGPPLGASQPTAVGGDGTTAAAPQAASSVPTSLMSQSPPPSPVAVNAGTPLLRANGRCFSGAVRGGTRGSDQGSASNFHAVVNQGSDENSHQAPPTSAAPSQTTSRPSSMGADALSAHASQHQAHGAPYARRSKYHFVPTDSEESSDDDDSNRGGVDNTSFSDPFPRVASAFVGGGSGSFSDRSRNDSNAMLKAFMENTTACSSMFKSRTKMFSDERSFFFISVIVCCLIEGVTMLIFTFADVSTAAVNDESRGMQDVISSPQACSLFIVFTVLVHTLHVIVETLLGTSPKGDRRIVIAVATIVAAYTVAVGLILAGVSEKASEYVSTTLEIVLAVAFVWTAKVLPARIRTFGESTEQTAVKVRRVCIIASASLMIRFVVFFPILQDRYGSLGEYAATIFNVVDMIPLGVSLVFLHTK